MEGRWTITVCDGCREQIIGIQGHVGQCEPADETEVPVVPCDDAAITGAVEALIGAPYDWRTYSPAQVVEVVARGLAGQSAEEIDAAYFRAAGETP